MLMDSNLLEIYIQSLFVYHKLFFQLKEITIMCLRYDQNVCLCYQVIQFFSNGWCSWDSSIYSTSSAYCFCCYWFMLYILLLFFEVSLTKLISNSLCTRFSLLAEALSFVIPDKKIEDEFSYRAFSSVSEQLECIQSQRLQYPAVTVHFLVR